MSCFSHIVVDPIFKWIWKCSCTLKFKVFCWLLLMDRLNTRDMMQRRHWNIQDDTCVILPLMKTVPAFSLHGASVNGSGITWASHGFFNLTRLLMRWLYMLERTLVSHFSQRQSSLPHGIFGFNEMGRSSELKCLLSNLGGEILSMTFLFQLIESNVNIGIASLLGQLPYLKLSL